MNHTTRETISSFILRQVDVIIYQTTETGEVLWAVAPVELPDYWLDAFKTQKAAENFCKKRHIKVAEIRPMEDWQLVDYRKG